MLYPMLENENATRDMIDSFGGYNRNLRINDNEFYDMQNMTSDAYPALTTRAKRGIPQLLKSRQNYGNVCGMLYKNDFYHVSVDNGSLNFFKNGESIKILSTSVAEDVKRHLIMMGAYIIILPDKLYVNTANDDDYGNIETSFTSDVNSKIIVRPCDSEGKVYEVDSASDTMPNEYWDGFVWLDTSGNPATLKKYAASNSMWSSVATNYLLLTCTGVGKQIEEGDGVKVSGFINEDTQTLNNTNVVKKVVDNDNVVITGLVNTVQNKNIFTVKYNVYSNEGITELELYCVDSITEDAFLNKNININGKLYKCIGNTSCVESIEYKTNLSDAAFWLTSTAPQLIAVRDSVPGKIYTTKDGSASFNENLVEGKVLLVGDEIVHFLSIGYENIDGKQLMFFRIKEDITFKSGTNISFAEEYYSEHLKTTTLYLSTRGETITARRNDKISVALDSVWSQKEQITLSRTMPVMDYVVESKNRLWGCRFGEDEEGNFVNEIYASKLGDFKNWNCYEGISTDSYRASLGTSGKFTGAISYLGYPLFFKEDYLHTVYGNYPAQYQINETACRGVEEGSEESLAMINEVLYYKSKSGIMAYSGALPSEISYSLGNKIYSNAKACSYKNKYYVEMFDKETNANSLIVYDTKLGLWHKEEPVNAIQFCAIDNDVCYIDTDYNFKSLFATGSKDEEVVKWSVETGDIGLSYVDKKYITRISIRLSMELGANVDVYIQYDSNGEWIHKMKIVSNKLKTTTLPIRPHRCDHFKLRMVGSGDVKIYSISKTLQQGSDI